MCLEIQLEMEMKKLIPIALMAALTGIQLASVAQPTPMPDHQQGQAMRADEMKAWREELHQKMATAKSDQERQQLMAEQREKMPGMQGFMHAQTMKRMQSMPRTSQPADSVDH